MNLNVVLLSGGMDSAACLLDALSFPNSVTVSVTFAYGQKAEADEVFRSAHISKILSVPHTVLGVDFAKTSSSLTAGSKDRNLGYNTPISSAFLPGRNLVFLGQALSVAAEYARLLNGPEKTRVKIFVGGHVSDVEPDCSPKFFRKAASALVEATKGYFKHVQLCTPLIDKTKTQVVKYLLDRNRSLLMTTNSCYIGEYPGCGDCAACRMRIEALANNGIDFDAWKARTREDQKRQETQGEEDGS